MKIGHYVNNIEKMYLELDFDMSKSVFKCAVHAIRHHDELVEALNLLIDHFEIEDENARCMDNNILHYGREVLSKESKE